MAINCQVIAKLSFCITEMSLHVCTVKDLLIHVHYYNGQTKTQLKCFIWLQDKGISYEAIKIAYTYVYNGDMV